MVKTYVLALFLLAGCVTHPSTSPALHGNGSLGMNQLTNATVPLSVPPITEPIAISPKGEPMQSLPNGQAAPTQNRTDTTWARLWVKATPGQEVHYNINQAAKAVDSSAANWSRVFAQDAPYRDLDRIFFCGPTDTITIEVADSTDWTLIYQGQITGVPPCP